jgi:hypothetical protein
MGATSAFALLAVALAATAIAHAGPQGRSAGQGAPVPTLRYVAGSSAKVEQLTGEEDKERHQPTLSRTVSRYGLEGTDLGYSFEHAGRAYFLFGDTVGRLNRALDTIATTDARDPEAGVRLDFLTTTTTETTGRRGGARGRGRGPAPLAPGESQYLTVEPPGIAMGPFEVPVSGLSLNGQMYVVVITDHSDDRSTDRSVLTKFSPPASFKVLRTVSRLPAGHFAKMSLHAEPSTVAGLPRGGPFVLIWGTGQYRKSDAYLSIVPAANFESGRDTRYFAGLDAASAPKWSEHEGDAVPIVRNGTMGDLSVTWCQDLGLWLMTYDSRSPAPLGIEFAYSPTPWGPWSEPQVIFSASRDGAIGKFIHDPRAQPPDGLSGPVIGQGRGNPDAVRGGEYAPYVVERWTKKQGSELNLYYVLSTWNPYEVVLMKSQLHIQ